MLFRSGHVREYRAMTLVKVIIVVHIEEWLFYGAITPAEGYATPNFFFKKYQVWGKVTKLDHRFLCGCYSNP